MVRDTCMSCGGVYMIICLLSGVLLGQLGAAGADRRNDKRQTMNVGGVWASIWGKSDRLSAAPSMVPRFHQAQGPSPNLRYTIDSSMTT
jgi:hypothetical protein